VLWLLSVAFCALATTGCSFVFVEPPPNRVEKLHPRTPLSCTSSEAAPAVDLLVCAFQVVRTGIAVNASDSDYRDFPIGREADIGLGASLGAIFLLSSFYGFSVTNDCDSARKHRSKAIQKWVVEQRARRGSKQTRTRPDASARPARLPTQPAQTKPPATSQAPKDVSPPGKQSEPSDPPPPPVPAGLSPDPWAPSDSHPAPTGPTKPSDGGD
jgi:hypothetical protein